MTAKEIEEHIRLDDGGMPSEMIDMHVALIKQYAIDNMRKAFDAGREEFVPDLIDYGNFDSWLKDNRSE